MGTQQHLETPGALGRSLHEATKLRLPGGIIIPAVFAGLTCWAPRRQAGGGGQGRELSRTGIIEVCCQNPAVHEQGARAAPRSLGAPGVQQRKVMPVPTGSTQRELLPGHLHLSRASRLTEGGQQPLASPGATLAAGPVRGPRLVARNQRAPLHPPGTLLLRAAKRGHGYNEGHENVVAGP